MNPQKMISCTASAPRHVLRPLATATLALYLTGCPAADDPETEVSSTTSESTTEVRTESTGSTETSATSSTGTDSGSSSTTEVTATDTTSSGPLASTGSDSSTSGSSPACPHTEWYSCDQSWAACESKEPCGDNHRFDSDGCPREQCDSDNDCPLGQVCRDLINCAPKDTCIGPLVCDPFGPECDCIGGGSCKPSTYYCFPPDEYTCKGGEPPA